jgi:hypothetical protein
MPAVCCIARTCIGVITVSRCPQAADTKLVTLKHVAAILKTVCINYRVVHLLVFRVFLNFAIMRGINNVKRKILANIKGNKQ